MKVGSFNKLFKNIMYNKIILYILLALATLNLVKYLLRNNLAAIVIFFVVGFIVTCFTKNMTYVLLTAIIVTHLINTSNILNKLSILEGFDGKEGGQKNHRKHNNSHNSHNTNNNTDDNEDSEDNEDTKNSQSNPKDVELEVLAIPSTQKSSDFKNSKNKVSFKHLDEEADDNDDDNKATIDHSKTVQDAFANLDQLLGSGGVQEMTKNTKQLAQRQEQLIEAMEKMGPLMGMAQKMLTQLNSGAMGKIFGGGKEKE
jgi:hypothetical protein